MLFPYLLDLLQFAYTYGRDVEDASISLLLFIYFFLTTFSPSSSTHLLAPLRVVVSPSYFTSCIGMNVAAALKFEIFAVDSFLLVLWKGRKRIMGHWWMTL